MNTRNELLCAWSGVVFLILFTLGFWPLAHFIPPPLPSASAAEIAAMYQQHGVQIRLGLVLMVVSWSLIIPFAWNGLLVFWLGVVAFFGWYTVTFTVLRASIIRQGQNAEA